MPSSCAVTSVGRPFMVVQCRACRLIGGRCCGACIRAPLRSCITWLSGQPVRLRDGSSRQ
eukprot:4455581-Prorocentrum_lima.AAC.1